MVHLLVPRPTALFNLYVLHILGLVCTLVMSLRFRIDRDEYSRVQ